MSLTVIALLVVGLGLVAWVSARAKATAFSVPGRARPHSLPAQHGWYVALWTVVPALLFVAVWSEISGNLIYGQVMASPEAASLPAFPMQRQAILGEAYAIATGQTDTAFNPEARTLAPVYAQAIAFYSWIGLAIALVVAFAGGAWSFSRLSPLFRARTRVERVVMALLLVASLVAILTTLGIFVVLVFETVRFFSAWSARATSCSALSWGPRPRSAPDQAGSSGATARCRCSGARSSSARSSR